MIFTFTTKASNKPRSRTFRIIPGLAAALIFVLSLTTHGIAKADSGSHSANFSLSALEYSLVRAYANRFDGLSKTHSGTVAFSLKDKRNEIAVPFLWHRGGVLSDALGDGSNLFSMDLQFRRYASEQRDGTYAGLAARYTNLSGTVDSVDQSTSLVGAGVTLGYRHFYQDAFYVNVGVTWIHNFDGEENLDSIGYGVNNEFLLKDSVTFDILKVGILFN